ncbi:MAG: LysM peptidoglycan-binding domain-containing protein, partial [Ahrensia sp.]
MRNGETCPVRGRIIRLASAVSVVAVLAGCSSDVMRFTDDFYTASIPTRPRADVSTVSPVASVSQQRAAIANSFPGATVPAAAGNQPFPPPQNYPGTAPLTTGSVVSNNATAFPTAPNALPVYSGIGVQSPVQSAQLPPPTMPAATASAQIAKPAVEVAQARLPQTTTRPADLVDTTAAQKPFTIEQSNNTDPISTGSVQRPQGDLVQSEGWTRTGGTYVSVRAGETIYNMAKRYGVPANAIMEANGIQNPDAIGIGQRILIPTYVYSRTAPVSAPDADSNVRAARSTLGGRTEFGLEKAPMPEARPVTTASVAQATAPQPVATPQANVRQPASGGTYIVQSGDSLSAISRRTGASVNSIKLLNGMSSDVVRVGQKLMIPGLSSNGTQVASNNSSVDPITTSSLPAARPQAGYTPPASQTNDEVASLDRNSDAAAPATTGIPGMRWPAQGRIITGFQADDGGVPNEGIDISLPVGTPIKAAENGVVIYAGDGLKELGKTVLVRHGNGVVTVYGHADQLKVNRGDSVSRGQVIASSGMSGNARKP